MKGWLALLCAAAVAGCATIYNPATQRQETVLDSSVEMALGQLARAQMGLSSLSMGRVTAAEVSRVRTIGERIAKASDRQDVPYQFGVIEEKSLNAFTLPGGTIYVHTGILDRATDEELASVLAHEVGHVAARHVSKHLQADLGVALLLQIVSRAGASEAAQVGNSFYGLISKGFSRQDELEADRLAVKYLRKAGYDPQALVSFFKELQKDHPEGVMDQAMVWQRTHPLTSQRIEEAEKEIRVTEGESFCPTCGRTYPLRQKFCVIDGTALKKTGP